MPSRQESDCYHESLQPPWWQYTFALIGSAVLGIAYGSALGVAIGVLVAALTTAFLVLALFMSAPRIRVTETAVHAGSAVLPIDAVGTIQVLSADEMRSALNLRTAPASSFTIVRSWAAPRGIRLDLADSTDPHAVWLLSSRDPHHLADTLRRVRDRMAS